MLVSVHHRTSYDFGSSPVRMKPVWREAPCRASSPAELTHESIAASAFVSAAAPTASWAGDGSGSTVA